MTDAATIAQYDAYVAERVFVLVRVRIARPLPWDKSRPDFNACLTYGTWVRPEDDYSSPLRLALEEVEAWAIESNPDVITVRVENHDRAIASAEYAPDDGDGLWNQLRRLGCAPYGIHRLY